MEEFVKYKPDEMIGNYVVVKRLGKGEEGIVYKVRDNFSGGDRVLKIYHPEVNKLDDIKKYCKKLEKLSSIDGVIKYYHAGFIDTNNQEKYFYTVMDYFAGEILADKKQLPLFRSLKIIKRLVEIVEQCHKVGVYVGDLHGENILIDESDNLRIIDVNVKRSLTEENKIEDLVTVCSHFHEIASGVLSPEIKNLFPKGKDAILKRYNSVKELRSRMEEVLGTSKKEAIPR